MHVTVNCFGVTPLIHVTLHSFGVILMMHVTVNCFGVKGRNCDSSENYAELVGYSVSAL